MTEGCRARQGKNIAAGDGGHVGDRVGRLPHQSLAYDETLGRSGALILAQALEPVETATTVRVGKRKLFATDGRFAETKEQPGGSILIEVRPIKELKPSLRRIR